MLSHWFDYSRDTERDRQRHRQREKQALHRSPMWDLILDSGITTWARGSCPTTEPPRRPWGHPSIHNLLNIFIMNRCWVLLNVFVCASIVMIIGLFYAINMMLSHWFDYVKQSFYPRNKSILIMVHDFFLMCCWIWFACISFRMFTSIFIRNIGFISWWWHFLALVSRLTSAS